jgi:hypothetical protein
MAGSQALNIDSAESKFYQYKGMPKNAGIASSGIPMQDKNSPDNFVALSAAQDTEYALATSKGSFFTLGLLKSIREARSSGAQGITPRELHRKIVNYVHTSTNPQERYTPVISGSNSLKNSLLRFQKTEQAGEYWQQMVDLVEQAQNRIGMQANKKVYRIGEEIVMDVQIPVDGYLNIITVSANDSPQVVFPNQFMQNNRMQRGVFSTRSLKFDFYASDPKGANLTVAIVTQRPLNLYSSGAFSRNNKGELSEIIAELDASGIVQAREMLERAISLRVSNDNSDSDMFVGAIVTAVQ